MAKDISMKRAVILQMAAKYSTVLVQLGVTAVLARLLTPDEFGLVAIITVFTNLFVLLSDLGISTGIVQYRELDDDDISGLLTFSAILATVLTLLFCLASFPISMAYNDERLIGICLFSSLGVFCNTVNAVPNGVLLREKRFRSMSVRLVVSNLVGGTAAIAMAFAGGGVYAIVANTVVASAIVLVWNLALSGVHIAFRPFGDVLRMIGRYSGFQAASQIVNYFSRNLDKMIMGRFFGTSQLGFYDKAYKLTTYPNSFLTAMVASVLQPYLSDYRNEPSVIYHRFLRITKMMFAIGIPISTILVGCSSEVTFIMYGSQWGSSVPMLKVLSISVMFQLCTSLTGAVYQSLGATDWAFKSTVVNTGITVAGIFIGVGLGDMLALCALIAVAFCLNPIATYWYLVHGAFEMSMRPFALEFVPLLSIALIMVSSAWFTSDLVIGPVILSFFIKGFIFCVVYLALLLFMKQFHALDPVLPSKMREADR